MLKLGEIYLSPSLMNILTIPSVKGPTISAIKNLNNKQIIQDTSQPTQVNG
jgi:hypothetical protein